MNTDSKPNSRFSSLIRPAAVIVSITLLVFAVMPNFAQDIDQADQQSGTSQISREDLRAALSEILLGDQAQLNAEQTSDTTATENIELIESAKVGERLAATVQHFPDYPEAFSVAFAKLTNAEIGWTGFRVFIAVVFTVIVGLLAELVTTRNLLGRLYVYVTGKEKTTALKYKFIVMRVIIQLIGVAVLALVTYLISAVSLPDNRYFQLMFTQFLAALVMFRLWLIMLRNIFSPARPEFRPIPLDDDSSRHLYRWFILFFGIIEFGDALRGYLEPAGMNIALVNGLLIPLTLSLNLIILTRVWVMRKKITGMFVTTAPDYQNKFAQEFLHTAWPFAFTAWLLSLWILWLYKAFLGQWDEAQYVSISWWITLAFFVADRIFHGLVKNVINIKWLHGITFEVRSSRFIRIVQNGFRLLMIALAMYMFSLALGLPTDSLMEESVGNKLLGQGINLLVIATIAYIVWEFFNALIERSLPEEMDAITTLEEGEGGGAGATRAETLLPLMRTCLTVVLITFLVLSVLNSLGVAITPLLAGAGVVGIAIGFGAQKLVQDVLSGIFFLVDDAFRKSEYIEIEDLRGTVEKISLRSMQLRHHLGAVQTIPYGEIKTVKNLSRDWITMKLELRLPYDADIEQIRKIIKKVGQDMLKDETMGPSFILPLKSQGVMRVEESALIVRMKFTTKPGEQWVVRREAYRNVRDALSQAGIFFAHREVRVRLPDDLPTKAITDDKTDDKTGDKTDKEAATKEALTGAAAAAASSIIAKEAETKGKVDFSDDM